MIQKLILKNFRTFENKELFFSENLNLIIWDNWKWKTNILEAISLLCNNPLQEISYESLVKNWEKNMFISGIFDKNQVSISFLKDDKKKKILINNKSTLKKNLTKYSSKTIVFSPITMNLFYFSPNSRRKFLDKIIEQSFPKHKENLKKYDNILKNRNKLLKKIKENNNIEDKKNLDFWTKQLIESAIIILKYRKDLINFITKNIDRFEKYFDNKDVKVEFLYESKINIFEENIKKQFEEHFEKNIDLEIILARTTAGPHLDDFDIKINWYKIIEYASRWEIKSIILALKFLEIDYLEKNTKEIPIILIDDFLSEIDQKHKSFLLARIKDYQVIITSIFDIEIKEKFEANKIFLK